MNLKFIKEDHCPVCGNREVVKEEVDISQNKIVKHSNGVLWEKRTFSCGQVIEYSPNFSRTISNKYNVCTNNQEYQTKIEKRNTAKRTVLDFINNLTDVDDDYKEQLKERFYLL